MFSATGNTFTLKRLSIDERDSSRRRTFRQMADDKMKRMEREKERKKKRKRSDKGDGFPGSISCSYVWHKFTHHRFSQHHNPRAMWPCVGRVRITRVATPFSCACESPDAAAVAAANQVCCQNDVTSAAFLAASRHVRKTRRWGSCA